MPVGLCTRREERGLSEQARRGRDNGRRRRGKGAGVEGAAGGRGAHLGGGQELILGHACTQRGAERVSAGEGGCAPPVRPAEQGGAGLGTNEVEDGTSGEVVYTAAEGEKRHPGGSEQQGLV